MSYMGLPDFLSKNNTLPVFVVTIIVSNIRFLISMSASIGGALISRFHKSCLISWNVQIIFLSISNAITLFAFLLSPGLKIPM